MPAEKIYHDVTYAKFASVREAAAGWGLAINNTHGEASTAGVTFTWEWLKTKRTLKIAILKGGIFGEDGALLFVDGLLQNVLNAASVHVP